MSLTEKRSSATSALGFVARCCMAHQQAGTFDPQGEGSGTQKKTGKLPEQLDHAHSSLTHEHRAAALVAEAVGPEGALAAAQVAAAAAAAAAVVAEGTSADPYPDWTAHGRGDHKASAWVEIHQQHAVLETAWVGT